MNSKVSRAKVTLKPGREASLKRRHRWVFSGAIAGTSGGIPSGALADIHAANGEFLAAGHYSSEDSIALRVLSFSPIAEEQEFLVARLQSAVQLRRELGLLDSAETNAFRLINAEGDGLPGLVVDLYDSTAVVECHSEGMKLRREAIAAALREVLPEKLQAVFDKSPSEKRDETESRFLWGGSSGAIIKENSLLFHVDWQKGQKTGFYLDQRENRRRLQDYARGRSVLNAFSYTGAFSIYALAGGAKQVTAVDSSAAALALLDENLQLNFSAPAHQTQTADCLEYLKEIPGGYDLIVLDPPAFVKHQGALKGGIKGYESVNFHALRQIGKNGILFTFSCSQFMSRDLFRETVMRAVLRAGRSAKVLHELTQAPCHPVDICHPEGLYLKGLVLMIE